MLRVPLTAMKWRWLLGSLQLMVAIALYAYGPCQLDPQTRAFRMAHPRIVYPFAIMHVAYGISYPAVLGARLLNLIPLRLLFVHGLYRLTLYDFYFAILVFVLWYWIGLKIDRWLNSALQPAETRPRWLLVATHTLGLAISVVVGVTALSAVVSMNTSLATTRSVALAAFLWSIAFSFYFIASLRSRLITRRSPSHLT